MTERRDQSTIDEQREKLLTCINEVVEKQTQLVEKFNKVVERRIWDKWGPTVIGCLASAFLIAIPSYIAVLRSQAVIESRVTANEKALGEHMQLIKSADEKAGKAIVDAGLAIQKCLRGISGHVDGWHKDKKD